MMNIAQRDRILASVNQVIGRKESVVPNTQKIILTIVYCG